MSKITNDGLTRSGTGYFIAVSIWQQWASKGYRVVWVLSSVVRSAPVHSSHVFLLWAVYTFQVLSPACLSHVAIWLIVWRHQLTHRCTATVVRSFFVQNFYGLAVFYAQIQVQIFGHISINFLWLFFSLLGESKVLVRAAFFDVSLI